MQAKLKPDCKLLVFAAQSMIQTPYTALLKTMG